MVQTMSEKYEITYADMCAFDNEKFEGFRIMWGAKDIGFGTTDFFHKKEEDELDEYGEPKYPRKLYCDNECMNKEFIQAVLMKFIDESIFMDKNKEDSEK